MKKPIELIAPGVSLFLIGTLMLVALTGFRSAPDEADVRVASSSPHPFPPALIALPKAEHRSQVIAAARALPQVTGVAEMRSGTRWLNAWTSDGAASHTSLPPGHQVPMDVSAVDPDQFRDLVPESLRPKFAELGSGGAILSRSAAAHRSITETGALHFPGISIPVIGVVDDHLIRNHEVVMANTTGESIGLSETRYLVIGLKELAAGKSVEDAIRAAIPPEASMRVRGPQGSGASTALSPLLSMSQIKSMFGEYSAVNGTGVGIRIDPAWIDANTEMATIPLLGTFRCHKKVIPHIADAFAEIERQGLAPLIRPGDFGGCFSPRYIRSGKDAGLSRHSWGIAIDFNVSTNGYGDRPTMDMRLVEIMERHGFSWGGRWNYPDGMHFEYARHE